MHTTLLFVTLAALLSGPLWYLFAQKRLALLSFLDGFVLVSISGLVLLEVLPQSFAVGGSLSLVFLGLGLLGPTALEHWLTHARREAHLAALALAILGLVLHSVGDGAALAAEDTHTHGALGLAIAIHSIPVGLVVWWLLFPVFGGWLPAVALLAMCAGTVVGYVYGVSLSALLGAEGWAWFQALIAGSILHVIFGRPHLDEDAAHHHSKAPYEGLGNLAALATLGWLAFAHAHEAPASNLAMTLLQLALAMAPALLLAYALICVLTWAGVWPAARKSVLRSAITVIGVCALLLAVNRWSLSPDSPWMLVILALVLAAAHLYLGAVTQIDGGGRSVSRSLQAGLVDAVDRGAMWMTAILVLAAVWLTYSGLEQIATAAASCYAWPSFGVVAVLYAGALLRRGGRALLADLFGSGHAAHD